MTQYLDNEFHLDLTGEGKCDALGCGADAVALFKIRDTHPPDHPETVCVSEYCPIHAVEAEINTISFSFLRGINVHA